MRIRDAFVESTYGRLLLGTAKPRPLVWVWWLRVEAAYKRMWPGEEMLEPPTGRKDQGMQVLEIVIGLVVMAIGALIALLISGVS